MIVASIDLHNYSNIITIAFQQQLDPLFKRCFKVMEAKASEIICTSGFLNLPLSIMAAFIESSNLEVKEVELFLMLVKWCYHQGDSLAITKIKYIFEKIRYPLISVVDLLDKIRPTNMADPDLYKAALEYHHMPEKFVGPEKQIELRKFHLKFLGSEGLQIEYTAKGTLITKTANISTKCLTIIKTCQVVRFKIYVKKCTQYIRLHLFYSSAPKNMVAHKIYHDVEEVDGSVSMDGSLHCWIQNYAHP